MLGVSLALASSLCWGVADFGGGLLSRRCALIAVLLVGQASAVLLALALVGATGGAAPDAAAAAWALGGGVLGCSALAAFYRGLAIGTMTIVAPISATGAAVPVLVGVLRGERPSAPQVLGIGLALLGIVLAAREPGGAPPARAARASVGLALVAAGGFGTFFVAVDEAAGRASVAWVTLCVRLGEVTLLALAAALMRPRLPRAGRDLAMLGGIGALDAGANALYAAATTEGLLSVVAVLGSLYPAVTVVLARLVLGERISRGQEVGVVATLAGVAAISAG